MVMETLRIAAWNSNGLLKHKHELEIFLESHKIDICLISETHFTKESYIKIKGYQIYNTIHPSNKSRGGTAVIIKENISHYEDIKYETNEIQATLVRVKTESKDVTVVAIYCPPRHIIKNTQFEAFFQGMGNHFIVGGDLNAKHTYWGSRLISPRGKELYEAAISYRCEFQSTSTPTYWPTDNRKIPDLIDFFILKGINSNYTDIEATEELSSDHTPIILTVSQTVIRKQKPSTLVNVHTDWDGFKNDLDRRINLKSPLKTIEQLETELQNLIANIQLSAWENTPKVEGKTRGINYPIEIREKIKEKRKARRRWQESRTPLSKNVLNRLGKELKNMIIEIKNETFSNYMGNLSYDKTSDYSLWKAARSLKRPITQSPPLKKEDGTWARDSKEKVELFADYLEDTFCAPTRQTAKENLDKMINPDKSNIRPATVKEVIREIKTKVKQKKAPGYDLITGKVVKELSKKAIVKLTSIINAAIRLTYVPRQWKVAEIVMIPKPGKPTTEKTSYRPISLLPVLSKVFEGIILTRLMAVIQEKMIIPLHQFGFRQKHSTIDQVHRLTSTVEKALEEKNICSALFLDVAQAFDKVWHVGINNKLKAILPQKLSKLLSSYLADRLFRVRMNSEYSELRNIKAGVPQGSVLGPILYLIYTHDLPQDDDVLIATFADDTAILAVGKDVGDATSKLQNATDHVTAWTKKWRIKINETKSVHVNFTNRKGVYKPVYIDQNIVPYANSAKYLGMTLDAKLRWKEHVKKKREQLGIQLKKMHWLIGRKSELSVHNKLVLYKQVLKPVWLYGIQLWGCTKKSNIKIIQTFQNKVLRNLVKAPWYVSNDTIHRDLKIETVEAEIQKQAKKHESRLHNHQNVEVLQLLDNAELVRRLKRLKPFDLV